MDHRSMLREQIIEKYIKPLDLYKENACIAVQGGLARGTFTADSDIDIVMLFETGEEGSKVFKGVLNKFGKRYDVRHIYIDQCQPIKWLDKIRYIYCKETIILKDRNDLFQNLIKQAVMSKEEQLDLIVRTLKKLENKGIVIGRGKLREWRGLKYEDPVDYWVKKGDLLAGHGRLNECITLIIKMIYALNKEFTPSSKGRFNFLRELAWLPDNFYQHLEVIMCYRDFSLNEFWRRVTSLDLLLNSCITRALELELVPLNISWHYKKINSNLYSDNTKGENNDDLDQKL